MTVGIDQKEGGGVWSWWENRGRSARGTSHVARLEFPRETGLILRCAGTSSVLLFSFLQYFPASGSFPTSQFFASGGQSIGRGPSPLP